MIGVAFAEQPHPGIPLAKRRATHCKFMGRALNGDHPGTG